MADVLQPLFGAVVILGIGYTFSTNRRAINWTAIAWGLGLQIVFAFLTAPGTIMMAKLLVPETETPKTLGSVFALCGFAACSSIGMQLGGIGGLAPNRRHHLTRLGRARCAGTLANFMTATSQAS